MVSINTKPSLDPMLFLSSNEITHRLYKFPLLLDFNLDKTSFLGSTKVLAEFQK